MPRICAHFNKKCAPMDAMIPCISQMGQYMRIERTNNIIRWHTQRPPRSKAKVMGCGMIPFNGLWNPSKIVHHAYQNTCLIRQPKVGAASKKYCRMSSSSSGSMPLSRSSEVVRNKGPRKCRKIISSPKYGRNDPSSRVLQPVCFMNNL
jgi:hypothetical protein